MPIFDFIKKKKKVKEPEIEEKAEKEVAKEPEVEPKKKVEPKKAGKGKEPAVAKALAGRYAFILKNPRITEKATELSTQNVYTFDVPVNANKIQIKRAIWELYGVDPVKIRTAHIPKKAVSLRGRRGTGVRGGGKKAMVYLKEGETIEFV